jgi:hypothetical protein
VGDRYAGKAEVKYYIKIRNHKQEDNKMMTRQELKQNTEKQQYTRDRCEKDLRHRIRGEDDFSADKSHKRKRGSSENLLWRCKPPSWKRIVNRGGDPPFSKGGRQRMVIDEVFRLLES